MNHPKQNIDFYGSMEEAIARLDTLKVEGKVLTRARNTAPAAECSALDARISAIEEEIQHLASQVCFLKKS